MPKPHRFLLDRVSGYADEAAAFMRRRRLTRRQFARLHYSGGRAVELAASSEQGGAIFEAARDLIELTDPARER
jgi:hypothetical protein